MSTEHIVRRHTLPRPPSQIVSLFTNKLSCILCNVSLDTTTHEHKCTLRPHNKDIIITKNSF